MLQITRNNIFTPIKTLLYPMSLLGMTVSAILVCRIWIMNVCVCACACEMGVVKGITWSMNGFKRIAHAAD